MLSYDVICKSRSRFFIRSFFAIIPFLGVNINSSYVLSSDPSVIKCGSCYGASDAWVFFKNFDSAILNFT